MVGGGFAVGTTLAKLPEQGLQLPGSSDDYPDLYGSQTPFWKGGLADVTV